jgi:nucleoside-diphosphate-sugar epimerase
VNTGGKIAVAGATGRVGRHVVDVLEEQGHEVVPISRGVGRRRGYWGGSGRGVERR